MWLRFLALSFAIVVCGYAQQPAPARAVTVAAIPGIVDAGARWQQVWAGDDNADGLVGTADGGLLFAQEQKNRVRKVMPDGSVVTFADGAHGPGAVALDARGNVIAVERTCTDPGGNAAACTEPTGIAQLTPERKVLANAVAGKSLGRINDLMVSRTGHVYFTSNGAFHLAPSGAVAEFGANLRTNGILLSRDERALYVTNGSSVVVFDIGADGKPVNQREFAKLEAGGAGDGLALDAEGRIYVTSQPGVQVFALDGKYLGLIPTPRPVISAAFSGPGKRILYVVGSGAEINGVEHRTPEGVRNNGKTIYQINMLAAGFAGRAK